MITIEKKLHQYNFDDNKKNSFDQLIKAIDVSINNLNILYKKHNKRGSYIIPFMKKTNNGNLNESFFNFFKQLNHITYLLHNGTFEYIDPFLSTYKDFININNMIDEIENEIRSLPEKEEQNDIKLDKEEENITGRENKTPILLEQEEQSDIKHIEEKKEEREEREKKKNTLGKNLNFNLLSTLDEYYFFRIHYITLYSSILALKLFVIIDNFITQNHEYRIMYDNLLRRKNINAEDNISCDFQNFMNFKNLIKLNNELEHLRFEEASIIIGNNDNKIIETLNTGISKKLDILNALDAQETHDELINATNDTAQVSDPKKIIVIKEAQFIEKRRKIIEQYFEYEIKTRIPLLNKLHDILAPLQKAPYIQYNPYKRYLIGIGVIFSLTVAVAVTMTFLGIAWQIALIAMAIALVTAAVSAIAGKPLVDKVSFWNYKRNLTKDERELMEITPEQREPYFRTI